MVIASVFVLSNSSKANFFYLKTREAAAAAAAAVVAAKPMRMTMAIVAIA